MESENNIIYKNALDVKNNDYMMIDNHPCKITDVKTSKTGKHGGCKCHFYGTDIFTDKKSQTLHMSSDKVSVPIVNKLDYQVYDIIEDEEKLICSLLDSDNTIKGDIKTDDSSLINEIKKGFEADLDVIVTVLSAMSEEKIVSIRCK